MGFLRRPGPKVTGPCGTRVAPGNVRAIGRAAVALPGDTYTTSPRVVCPALHLASWNVTGGSAG
jgi:hypothetical protein